MTRFGVILKYFVNVWSFINHLAKLWNYFLCYRANLHCCSWPNVENNPAIWSHWFGHKFTKQIFWTVLTPNRYVSVRCFCERSEPNFHLPKFDSSNWCPLDNLSNLWDVNHFYIFIIKFYQPEFMRLYWMCNSKNGLATASFCLF